MAVLEAGHDSGLPISSLYLHLEGSPGPARGHEFDSRMRRVGSFSFWTLALSLDRCGGCGVNKERREVRRRGLLKDSHA